MSVELEDRLRLLGRLYEKHSPAVKAEMVLARSTGTPHPVWGLESVSADCVRKPQRTLRMTLGIAAALAVGVWAIAVSPRRSTPDLAGESQAAAGAGIDRRVPEESKARVSRSPIALGDPVGYVQIPELDLSVVLVAGARTDDLQKGVGHVPASPLPGQPGNAVVVGHRTTYGAPFLNLDQLVAGDEVVVDALEGHFVYIVEGSEVVGASEEAAMASEAGTATLTLVTCSPKYSAHQRLVVTAALDEQRSDPLRPAAADYGQDLGEQSAEPQVPCGLVTG